MRKAVSIAIDYQLQIEEMNLPLSLTPSSSSSHVHSLLPPWRHSSRRPIHKMPTYYCLVATAATLCCRGKEDLSQRLIALGRGCLILFHLFIGEETAV